MNLSPLGLLLGVLFGAGILTVIVSFTPAPELPPAGARPPGRLTRSLTTMRRRFTRRQQIALAIAATTGLLIAITTGWVVAIAILPAAVWILPKVLLPPKSANVEVLKALGEWTRRLASLFQSGQYLTDVLAASQRSCPAAIATQVDALVSRLQARQPAPLALYAFADDIADETGDMIAATLIRGSTADEAALGRILKDLAGMVATEVRMRRQIITAQAGPRNEARSITLIAAAVMVYVLVATPYGTWYATPIGQVALLAQLAAFGACLAWMNRIATPAPSPRFLVRPQRYRDPMRARS